VEALRKKEREDETQFTVRMKLSKRRLRDEK
jgi:hypothetical protein